MGLRQSIPRLLRATGRVFYLDYPIMQMLWIVLVLVLLWGALW